MKNILVIGDIVGRCGRGDKQGRAFIQTYVPDHYVINLAAEQDYEGFYEQEAEMRKALIYPPFCDTCMIEFSSEIDKCANAASQKFMQLMREKLAAEKVNFPMRVLDPAKCNYERLNGKYRYRIIIKSRNVSEFRRFIADIYKLTFKLKEFANVHTFVDINGDISL